MIGLRLLGCCKLCEDSRSWRAFTCYGTLTFFFRWPLFIETGNLLPLPFSSQLRLRGDLRDPRGRVSGGWEDAGQTRQLQPHRWEGAGIWLTSDYSFFLEAIPKSYLCYFLNPKTKRMTKPLQTSTFFCSKGFLMMIFFCRQSTVGQSVLGHMGTNCHIFHACEFMSRPQCHSLTAFFHQVS